MMPQASLARAPRRSRAVAIILVLGCLVLSGCTGLPTFRLPGGSNDGAQSEAGRAQSGGLDGSRAPADAAPEQKAPPAAVPHVPTEAAPASVDVAPEELTGGIDEAAEPVTGDLPGWLVRFESGTKEDAMGQMASDHGAHFVFALKALPIAYILATDAQGQEMAGDRRALHVEREASLQYYDSESKAALRVPQVMDPVTGLKDSAGKPIDGHGVGIAVVDTGVDALHPDLPYAPAVPGGVVVANYKVVGNEFVALQDTDTSAGHGTHVAAILAGQGTGNPAVRGVAPGAKVYGLGIGDATTTLWAAEAFDWVLQNHNAVSPKIRVVQNSWGSAGSYDPNAALSVYVNAMVAQGITVVFSAGNSAGDGSAAQTSWECQIPTAGVICVAGFDDLGTGTRDGKVGTYSSRGAIAIPATWPDLSAPGTNVLSARPPAGAVTGFGLDVDYVQLSGTSQASPHVSGIVALMLQKNPAASPAQVEAKLKLTAYKFTDGGAYTATGMHYAKGAGLADAYAAVAGI